MVNLLYANGLTFAPTTTIYSLIKQKNMRIFTKLFCVAAICLLGISSASAKTEQVHATFENPTTDMAQIAQMNQHDTGTINFGDPQFVKYLIENYG